MLFVRSYFWWAEVLLVINFFNLSAAYFRHNTYARFIHAPAVAGPLAWTFVAIYSNGAIAVNAHSLPARIFANIAIWGILVYGLFFLAVYRVNDVNFTLCLKMLTRSRITPWDSHSVFSVPRSELANSLPRPSPSNGSLHSPLWLSCSSQLSLLLSGFFGKEVGVTHDSADRERAPLLDDA